MPNSVATSPRLALLLLGLVACDDAASLEDESSTTAAECIGIEGLRSHVGDAVAGAIAGASVSFESSCAYLPDDWFVQVEVSDGLPASACRFADEPPGVPWAPDTITLSAAQQRAADLIRTTQQEFAYGRLDETPATWDLFGQAIGDLNARLVSQEAGITSPTYLDALRKTPVYLRFELYAGGTNANDVMARLTARLPPDRSQWRVAIALQTRGIPFSWSHAKLAIRDGQVAMSSGIECDDLHDLGLVIGQGPARDALAFFDDLWSSGVPNECQLATAFPERFGLGCISKKSMELAGMRPAPAMAVANERVTIFSLARNTSQFIEDTSADAAVFAALGAATSSIKLSQDSLHYRNPITGTDDWSRPLVQILVQRLRAGVTVDVLTHHGHLDGNILYAQVEELLTAAGADAATRQAASCRLRVARHPSHNKFYMVDDRAFYIGSQNLYPSGIGGNQGVTIDLDEHGFLVDTAPGSGSQLADRVLNSFWQPHWAAAQQNGQLMANPRYACP